MPREPGLARRSGGWFQAVRPPARVLIPSGAVADIDGLLAAAAVAGILAAPLAEGSRKGRSLG